MRELVKDKSVTMEYFLEVSHLDAATADLLRKYDRDGNGSFSKDEVVAIILDLREAMQSNEMLGASNKIFKRLLIAATIFCILLLTSMFGLSYAVAALTAKTDINSQGVMTTVDGTRIIKTDSTAVIIEPKKIENGDLCIRSYEVGGMMSQIMSGSNVLMQLKGVNGTQTHVERISSSSIDLGNDDGSLCFTSASGALVCLTPSTECTAARRRKLSGTDDSECTTIYETEGQDFFDYMVGFAEECVADCQQVNGVWAPNECVCACLDFDFTSSWRPRP